MPLEWRQCPTAHNYEVLVIGGREVGVLTREDDLIACPECDAPDFVRLVGAVALPGINAYPYFNNGLNCIVTSKQHYDQVCREKNLVCIGDQEEQLLSEQSRAREKVIRERKEREEAFRRQPGYEAAERWTKSRECLGEQEEIRKAIREGRL
jgi:hypothetical protein